MPIIQDSCREARVARKDEKPATKAVLPYTLIRSPESGVLHAFMIPNPRRTLFRAFQCPVASRPTCFWTGGANRYVEQRTHSGGSLTPIGTRKPGQISISQGSPLPLPAGLTFPRPRRSLAVERLFQAFL